MNDRTNRTSQHVSLQQTHSGQGGRQWEAGHYEVGSLMLLVAAAARTTANGEGAAS